MSVYTHHSNVTCDDCGERHHVGNREDCIAVLKEQRDFAEAHVKELEEALREIAHVRSNDHGHDQQDTLDAAIAIAERVLRGEEER